MTETNNPKFPAAPVGDIVTIWREKLAEEGGKSLSQREMARRLTQAIQPHDSVSYAAVRNWEMDAAVPPYWFLVGLYQNVPGWPRQFALDLLRRVRPELWADPDRLPLGAVAEAAIPSRWD